MLAVQTPGTGLSSGPNQNVWRQAVIKFFLFAPDSLAESVFVKLTTIFCSSSNALQEDATTDERNVSLQVNFNHSARTDGRSEINNGRIFNNSDERYQPRRWLL